MKAILLVGVSSDSQQLDEQTNNLISYVSEYPNKRLFICMVTEENRAKPKGLTISM